MRAAALVVGGPVVVLQEDAVGADEVVAQVLQPEERCGAVVALAIDIVPTCSEVERCRPVTSAMKAISSR